MDAEKTLCFSGHRHIDGSKLPALYDRLLAAVSRCAEEGFEFFLCGGALGFDTLAARAVLEVKGTYSGIRLALALPYMGQESHWKHAEKAEYARIRDLADIIIYVSDGYYKGCLQARNRYMVNNAKLLVAYCHMPTGGTAYTMKYAIDNGVQCVNLYEYGARTVTKS